MSHAILWVPCLRMNTPNPGYADRVIRLFLMSHHDRGHIFFETDAVRPAPSSSALVPSPGCVWHILADTTTVDLTALQTFAGSIEMTVLPEELPMELLKTVISATKLKRLILLRQRHLSLAKFVASIEHIRTRFPELELWVDQPTTGWEALAYLLAIFPGLQPFWVQDDDLDKLLNIGEKLEREVFLADFSGRPPLKIPYLPHYVPGSAAKWRRVPIYPGFV